MLMFVNIEERASEMGETEADEDSTKLIKMTKWSNNC
jgi:hypothetical protein